MSVFKKMSFLCVLSLAQVLSAGEMTTERDVSMQEFMKEKYTETKAFTLPETGWKIKAGNDPKYAAPDYDDSKWREVKINTSIADQGLAKGGFYWYRVRFSVPENLISKDLLLNMGRISSFDEVYLNGTLVGTYGSVPPAAPVYGSSWTERKYYIPAAKSLFKSGENLIAVKVFTGYLGGMYKGIPYISTVKNKLFCDFNMKVKGENSLAALLTDSVHLNNYEPGSYIAASPKYAYISSEKPQLQTTLDVKVTSEKGDIIQQKQIPCTLKFFKWTVFSPIKLNASQPGKYLCEFILKSGNEILSQEKIPFVISEKKKFSVPVNENIVWNDEKSQKIEDSFGHAGPRFFKDGALSNTPSISDARGALIFSVFCSEKENLPMIFMNNVRPAHKTPHKPNYYLPLPGGEYDGFNDAWTMGYISIGKGKKQSLEISETSWTDRAWKYKFDDGKTLDFRISALSPALQLHTDSDSVNIFSEITKCGAGLPSRIAFMNNKNAVSIVEKDGTVSGKDMAANWILVWFNGSKGWDEFDIPWLFVLEKKPTAVSIGSDALSFKFSQSAGYISGMPLFGVKLISLSETASWKERVPDEIAKRCSFWSKVLTAAPNGVKRSFSIDYANDKMLMKDQFTHSQIKDEWNTSPVKLAPLPPALVLATSSGNIPIFVNKKNSDLDLATLHGPYLAISDADEYLVSIEKIVHFSNEVRNVVPGNQKETIPLQNELNKIFSDNMKYMNTHPWDEMFWVNKFVPGNVENPALSNVIQAIQYLPNDLKEKVSQAIKTEVENYLLFEGKPTDEIKPKLMPELQNRELTFTIKNPLSGKNLSSFTPRQDVSAIDSLCVESFRLYIAWQYAYTFNRPEFIEKNWEKINRFFNLIPNSHDWAVCISWDTFSGIRVGNGLQESGVIHAGASAMARMANTMKDFKLRDKAVYFSVMQLVGMQAALSANVFLRENRPWPTSHTETEEIEFTEKTRPLHYVEFNEFAGFSQNIILAYGLLNSPGSFILTPLPETMRPYKEIWPRETDDFFNPAYTSDSKQMSVDMLVHMTTNHPKSLNDVLSEHGKLLLKWNEKMNDVRAQLDYYGKITYKKLWTE